MTIGIYKITNKINGKFYIGSSNNIKNRWNCHISDLNKNKHHNNYLQNAWNKYGKDNFTFEIIEKTTKDLQLEREQYYLDLFKSYIRKIGYNIAKKSTGGAGFGIDNHFYGKHHTEESKKKIGNREYKRGKYHYNYGKPMSEERKEKLKKSNINRFGENSPISKLTNNQVCEIKKSLILGESVKVLSEKYNVRQELIGRIKRCETYSKVNEELNEKLLINSEKYGVKAKMKIKRETIIALHNKGISDKEISIKTGYTLSSVVSAIYKYKCKNNAKVVKRIGNKKDQSYRAKNILDLFKKGFKQCEIINKGYPRTTVQRVIKKYIDKGED